MKAQVIAHLREIAKEKESEHKYKAIAFQKAIGVLKIVPDSQFRKMTKKDFLALHGIGESVATAIMDVMEKRVKVTSIPTSVLELESLRGVGPKMAAKLYEDHGVTSVKALKRKLKTIAKADSALADRLAKSIEFYEKSKARIPTYEAAPFVAQLMDDLDSMSIVKRVELAGSIRRMSPTIKDVDVVVSLKKGKSAELLVATLKKAKYGVIASGDSKITLEVEATDDGQMLHVDVVVTKDKYFGNAVNYLTGSKPFNVAMRRRAKRMGFKVNEHYTKNLKTGKKEKSANEADLFTLLGVHFVPPECRMDGTEVGMTFDKLLQRGDIRGDLHLHSADFSRDSTITVQGYVHVAKEIGYKYIGISDHSKPNPSCKITSLADYAEFIRSFSQKGLRVFAGLELDLDSKGQTKHYKLKDINKLDYVVLATHQAPDKDIEKRLVTAMQKITVPKIIAHPTGRNFGLRDAAFANWRAIAKIAVTTNTVFEINCHPQRLDLPATVLRELRKVKGLRFHISSDAHGEDGFRNLPFYGVMQARRGLLDRNQILNSRSKPF